jgi:CHAT domain-containing protein/Tfp pilus assembly protein PilF
MRPAGRRHVCSVAILFGCVALSACTEPRDVRPSGDVGEATLAIRHGQLARALRLADEAIAQGAADPESIQTWTFKLLRAEVLLAKLDTQSAEPLLNAALPPHPSFAALRGRQAYLRARAQVLRGALQPALDTLGQATGMAPDDRTLRLDTGVLAGQIRLRLQRWSEAETRLIAVVSEAERAGDRYHQALALNNLGMGHLVRNRCDEALGWFEQLLALPDIDQTTVYATALNNAGACYTRLGQFDRAVAAQRRAVAAHEKTDRQIDLEQSLGELGSTYLAMEEFDLGLSHLERARGIATEARLSADAALWARNLSAAYVHLGRWDEAEQYNAEARRLNPADRPGKRAYDTLHAGHIAAGRGHFEDAERQLNDALAAAKDDPAIQWSAHDGLAKIAARQQQPGASRRHFEAALAVIDATRSDLLKTDYKLSFLTRLMGFYRGYVNELVDQGHIARALEVADSSRGRVLAERQGVAAPIARANIADLQRLARQSRSVLLSYWLGPTRSYLWIVTGDRVHLVPLPAAKDIEVLVREHQRAIESATADVLGTADTAGDRLYSLLLAPVAQWVPPGSKVVIAPDGALHRLNFETLPVNGSRTALDPSGARRHYLIEDMEIQVAPALSLVSELNSRPTGDRRVLLIGNPQPREPEFPALEYAPTEMEAIARHFPADRVTAYRSDGASPAAYIESGPDRFAMIHFTAHATANIDSPLDSAVILSGPDNAYKLYARDIAAAASGSRPRLSAELVTISACRSAGDRAYSGEGLVGFAWAFLRAGSRRVVAGLWDVDDRSTATLMDRFYEGIAAGAAPARALREAKLGLMKSGANYAKPYYWGAFLMYTVTP